MRERKLKGTKVVCVCVRHFRKQLASISGAKGGHGTKVLGTFAAEERKFQGCESSMERKFLEHSLLRSESSRGAKVPWNESSWTSRSPGTNVPRNESSTGAKVLSMDFSLPGTKVQRNEKARYRHCTGALMRITAPDRLQVVRPGVVIIITITAWNTVKV